MRKLVTSLAALACTALHAASTYSPDVSDLWWNPAESGWGVNLIQQSDTLFATFFIYGADGRARWLVASDMKGDGAPTDQPLHFRGRLFETTGPVVTSAPFNPAAVVRRDVGDVTFEFVRPNFGTITYTVDGVTVSKQIRRQTWAATDITGEFNVNRVLRPHLCNGPNTANDPVTNEALGTMTVAQSSGPVVRIITHPPTAATPTCTYTGTRGQEGRMSDVNGTYTCSDGTSGPFSLSEIEVSQWGFIAHISTNVRGCNMHGTFGGSRATVAEAPS
jgi:hypothetical protein